ncbi:nitroreductase family protein [Clostridium sp. KNHs205]|uniref:nitroreductase family protein n=1 Tax=Clostridium sp. KNHs205 TaxID=1449050 RepID=UPI00051AFE0E|nr:nitroreductase family protein [Clostridium sp. KNHs205]
MRKGLYEVIEKRKSVRKYDMNPLDSVLLQQIKQFGEEVSPLIPDIRVKFNVYSYEEVKSLMAIKAPHYVGIYSEKKDNFLLNAGYMLQQMDLYLSANNLGSCWLGMAKPSVALPEAVDGLDFVIMLAFGNPKEEVHRSSKAEFKRKTLEEIREGSGYEEALEAARLAPSARNTQTWYFICKEKEILVCRRHTGFVNEHLMARLNTIDAGIAMCHLELALENRALERNITFEEIAVPKGFIHLATVKL